MIWDTVVPQAMESVRKWGLLVLVLVLVLALVRLNQSRGERTN